MAKFKDDEFWRKVLCDEHFQKSLKASMSENQIFDAAKTKSNFEAAVFSLEREIGMIRRMKSARDQPKGKRT